MTEVAATRLTARLTVHATRKMALLVMALCLLRLRRTDIRPRMLLHEGSPDAAQSLCHPASPAREFCTVGSATRCAKPSGARGFWGFACRVFGKSLVGVNVSIGCGSCCMWSEFWTVGRGRTWKRATCLVLHGVIGRALGNCRRIRVRGRAKLGWFCLFRTRSRSSFVGSN